ncbi:DUF2442 domain-containing protein [Thiomicrorhabdus sp. Milos-T2]|uniref:DUF2442 domain-containing protein n=1 Tax=Thiomicrorhabdus sp. Milos-T2 TaxID=90814 RepID=UPI0004948C51|nr:DUF2442 domain-containing protein [Thiomicrorhabdus sp. Milos-T2]
MLLDVISVKTKPNFGLVLEFENGELRKFDMNHFLNKKPFNKIAKAEIFNQVKVQYGTLIWPGNIDIAPETLYQYSEKI